MRNQRDALPKQRVFELTVLKSGLVMLITKDHNQNTRESFLKARPILCKTTRIFHIFLKMGEFVHVSFLLPLLSFFFSKNPSNYVQYLLCKTNKKHVFRELRNEADEEVVVRG